LRVLVEDTGDGAGLGDLVSAYGNLRCLGATDQGFARAARWLRPVVARSSGTTTRDARYGSGRTHGLLPR
jgi:hypothetical protein